MASPSTHQLLDNVTDANMDTKQGDTIQKVPRDAKRRSPSSSKRSSKHSRGSISAPKARKKRSLRSKLPVQHIRRRTRLTSKNSSLRTISPLTNKAERRPRTHRTFVTSPMTGVPKFRNKRANVAACMIEAHIWLAIAVAYVVGAVVRSMEPALPVEIDKLFWGIAVCEWGATWEERLGCYLMMG